MDEDKYWDVHVVDHAWTPATEDTDCPPCDDETAVAPLQKAPQRTLQASQGGPQRTLQASRGRRFNAPEWAKGATARDAYKWGAVSVLPATCLNLVGNVAHTMYGGPASYTLFGATVAAVAGSAYVFDKGWSPGIARSLAATGAVAGSTWISCLSGYFWVDAFTWAATAVAGAASWAATRHYTGEHHAKTAVMNAKAESELINAKLRIEKIQTERNRQKIAEAKLLQMALQGAETGPDLMGRTEAETQLRHAVWAVHETQLPRCDVAATDTGWSATLDLPPSLSRSEFRTSWGKVASALAVPGFFQLEDDAQSNRIHVRYAMGSTLADLVPYRRQEPGTAWDAPVYLGKDIFGQDRYVSMAGVHTLVAGATSSGKSVFNRNVICQLADRMDVAFLGIDMKEGLELMPLEDLFDAVATTVEEAHDLMDWTYAEIQERAEILKAGGYQSWDPVRDGRPVVYLVFDEIAELSRADQRKGKDSIDTKVTSLLQRARALGLHAIVAGQAPSAKSMGGDTDARGQFMNRVCHRVTESTVAGFMFGSGTDYDPKSITEQGVFLLWDPQNTTPVPHKGVFLGGEEFRQEVERIAAYKDATRLGVVLESSSIDPWSDDSLSDLDRMAAYLEANPNASQRELGRALNISLGKVNGLKKQLGD